MEVISDYRFVLATGLLTVLTALGVRWWLRRRRHGSVTDALAAVGVEAMHDILLPDGMGGEIHVEYLLLTGHGLVVLDVKHVRGTVFASDRMQEWTAINRDQRFAFLNPQAALYDRVAALRLIARGVPVSGHVLFCEGADFSKGRPRDVILPDELLSRYRKPEKVDLERIMEAFQPYWERVRRTAKPAAAPGDSG